MILPVKLHPTGVSIGVARGGSAEIFYQILNYHCCLFFRGWIHFENHVGGLFNDTFGVAFFAIHGLFWSLKKSAKTNNVIPICDVSLK